MTRTDKSALISELKEKFENSNFFYVTDSSTLSVEKINKLRRTCFEKGIDIKVVKNALAIKAMENIDEGRNMKSIFDAFKGQSTVLFSNDGKMPATIIKEFRGKSAVPVLKAAYIDSDIFYGDDQLEILSKLKTKNELVGEVITILQSPAKNVISALGSSGQKLAGIVKTLQERPE